MLFNVKALTYSDYERYKKILNKLSRTDVTVDQFNKFFKTWKSERLRATLNFSYCYAGQKGKLKIYW